MQWHFDPATGSRYWLGRAGRLGFDPRQDVKGVADLALFPDMADELRDVRVADLIPQGYGSRARLLKVFDSGGTTGAPKRVVQLDDWMRHSAEQVDHRLRAHGLPLRAQWLMSADGGRIRTRLDYWVCGAGSVLRKMPRLSGCGRRRGTR